MSALIEELSEHPFTAGLDPAHIARIAACAEEVELAPGEVVARDGRPADATYLLRSGRVLLRSGKQVVETVEEHEVLGWSWLFEGAVWHVDAIAMDTVHAIRIDGAKLDEAMYADPALGHAVARRILHQVHRRLERARLRALDVFGGP